MDYEPDPKHKPLPTPGRRGSICPRGVDASALLNDSVVYGSKRYSTNGEAAFCGQCHDSENDRWHGYPVDWIEVPPPVVHEWIMGSRVDRRVVRRAWRQRP